MKKTQRRGHRLFSIRIGDPRKLGTRIVMGGLLCATLFPSIIFGSHGDESRAIPMGFLYLAILLGIAKIAGGIERYGHPSVVGELLGGMGLSFLALFGWGIITDMRQSLPIQFLAEFGAVLLLFQIGLESNIDNMRRVGGRALGVALVGVIVPFALGAYILGPLVFPGLPAITYLFIGAALVATSVGITASVYQAVGITNHRGSQTVLGAAVIDDILGLLILAIVSALASGGSVNLSFLVLLAGKAALFLGLAIALGDILARTISKLFCMINTGTGMKMALAIIIALVYAYLASLVGLAPIVGAFAAGLILDRVHFQSFNLPDVAYDLKNIRGFNDAEHDEIDRLIRKHQDMHVEELIRHVGMLIVPIFFVYTGLMIDAASLLSPSVYVAAIIISVGAILGKMAAGLMAEGSYIHKLFVGTSMIPRGEVGLIFAATGKGLGVIPDNVFSAIILVILITTLLPPVAIRVLALRLKETTR